MQSIPFPDKESIHNLLKEAKIEYKEMTHEKLDTVQQGLEYFSKNKPEVENYTFLKNLFLKNKAGGFYLLSVHNETNTDFKSLTKLFKAKSGNIRNAEEDKMDNYLHVKHGSLSPFAILNATEEQRKEISFHFDAAIQSEYVAVHPMDNTATVFLKKEDLLKLLKDKGIQVNLTDFKIKEEEKKTEEKKKEKKEKKPEEKKGNKDEDINVVGMTVKKEENFPDWFSEVITKSEMIDYYDISGCYILRPWSYEIWERIQAFLDERFKKYGVKNAYFPMFVSEKALCKVKLN
ncbi:MAG: hypothetical protein MJ252_02415 [archaeon]|nr:hypothetical protein [archaeon]